MDHLLYMEVLKIYIGIPRQLIDIVHFIHQTKMKFDLVKY